jgi:hypothetical protein
MATIAGCGADHQQATDPIESIYANYPTDFPVTVSSGTTPTISWSGVRGGSFVVTDYSTQNDTWYFFSKDPNLGFASPVTYGTLPAGAECGLAAGSGICPNARALTQGHDYLVSIVTSDFKIGAKFFRP